MNKLQNQVDYLRETLFNAPIIKNIDDDLILLAIIEPQTFINKPLQNKLLDKFKTSNNDQLELLGDSVLELIITDLLISKGIIKAGELTRIKSVIVRNISLICLMNDRNLCQLNKPIRKSCADQFEALIGALYTHLKVYDINVIQLMTQWMIDIWNIDVIIDDIIKHPQDENICQAIQRSYSDLLLVSQPYFDYIKDDYKKLEKIYEYYKLGPVEMLQQSNKQTGVWTIKIMCPMTLGCQYYYDKQGDKIYLGIATNQNKQLAINEASKHAIDIILNDYNIL